MIASLSRAARLRCAPFALFILLLAIRGAVPEVTAFDARWLYAAGVGLAAAVLLAYRHEYGELARQNLPSAREVALAVAVGAVVAALWTQLDAPWMKIGTATAAFIPVDTQGQLQWPLLIVRWLGATLLVPVMEELFWRSFLMRWIQDPVFEAVDPRRVGLRAIVLSVFLFMLAHTLWLAAVIAGLAYTWLYRRTGRLWVPVIAHAVTNGLLGVWVVMTASWAFW